MVSESLGLPTSTNCIENNFSGRFQRSPGSNSTTNSSSNIYSSVNGSSSNIIHNNLINMSHLIGSNHVDHPPRSPSSSSKVVGLIIWPEGSFSVTNFSSGQQSAAPTSSTSRGLVLGSILLDNKEHTMFADDLRQLVTGQIPNITFGFLSKEG